MGENVLGVRPCYQIDTRRCGHVISFIRDPENSKLSNKTIARVLGESETYIRAAKATYHMGDTVLFPISRIRCDGGTQMRADTPQDVAQQYCDAMKAGDIFPPVLLYHDGTHHWCADGHIRIAGAKLAGEREIEAVITMGSQRDAILAACKANSEHGARRTREDAQRAIMRLLTDPEWGKYGDRKIAKLCKVSHQTVMRLRTSIWSNGPDSDSPICGTSADGEVRTFERNGKTYTMNTGGINANREPNPCQVEVEEVPEEDIPDETDGSIEEEETETETETDDSERNGHVPIEPIPVVKPLKSMEQTENQFLTECGAVRNSLTDRCKKQFDADVKLYRDISKVRNAFADDSEKFRRRRDSVSRSQLNHIFNLTIKLSHPKKWHACPDCQDEIGISTGQIENRGDCRNCHGDGYIVY